MREANARAIADHERSTGQFMPDELLTHPVLIRRVLIRRGRIEAEQTRFGAAGLVGPWPGSARPDRHGPNVGYAYPTRSRQDRVSGLGKAIETAVAYGRSWGRSSVPSRRKPNVRSRLATGWGVSPHSGHAAMYAATAGVKRSRHRAQQTWVVDDVAELLGVVAICDRLSALLTGNVAREARRASLTEQPQRTIFRSPRLELR